MQSYENVIVTVEMQKEQFDMEVPAFLSIEDLAEKLKETFCAMRPQYVRYEDELTLVSDNGEVMTSQKCLAAYGVWDGGKIQCRVRKGEIEKNDSC